MEFSRALIIVVVATLVHLAIPAALWAQTAGALPTRSNHLDVKILQIDVDLHIDFEGQRISGEAIYRLLGINATPEIIFDGGSAIMKVEPKNPDDRSTPLIKVTVGSEPVAFHLDGSALVIERPIVRGEWLELTMQLDYSAKIYDNNREDSGFKWKTALVDGADKTVALYTPVSAAAYDEQRFLFPGQYEGQLADLHTKLRLPKRLCGLITGDLTCTTVKGEEQVLEFRSPGPVAIQQWALVVGFFETIDLPAEGLVIVVPKHSPYLEGLKPKKSVLSRSAELVDELSEAMDINNEMNSPYGKFYLVFMTDGFPEAGLLTGNFALVGNAILGSRWLKANAEVLNKLDKGRAAAALQALVGEWQTGQPWQAILMPNFNTVGERFLQLYNVQKR